MEPTLHLITNLFLEKSEEWRAPPAMDKGISFAAISTLRTMRLLPHVFAGIIDCSGQKVCRITVYLISSVYDILGTVMLCPFSSLSSNLKRTMLLSLSL